MSQWPPVLRRAGMRRIITILYPLREPIWLMFLGMQPVSLAILCEHLAILCQHLGMQR